MGDEFTDSDLSLWQTMIAGSAAGMSEHLVMFPFDTMKTKIMSERVGWRYHHLVSTTRLIMAEEGAAGFYRGFAPAFLSAIPSHAALFTAYELAKSTALDLGASQEVAYLVGAGAATCVHDTVSVPFDVVKQRLQENSSGTSSALRCFREVRAKEGISAFTRSLPATYLMNFPNQAVHWLTYETAKKLLGKEVEERVALDFFLCGVCILFFCAFILGWHRTEWVSRLPFFPPNYSFHLIFHKPNQKQDKKERCNQHPSCYNIVFICFLFCRNTLTSIHQTGCLWHGRGFSVKPTGPDQDPHPAGRALLHHVDTKDLQAGRHPRVLEGMFAFLLYSLHTFLLGAQCQGGLCDHHHTDINYCIDSSQGAAPRMAFYAPSTALTMTTYETMKQFLMSNSTASSGTAVILDSPVKAQAASS